MSKGMEDIRRKVTLTITLDCINKVHNKPVLIIVKLNIIALALNLFLLRHFVI